MLAADDKTFSSFDSLDNLWSLTRLHGAASLTSAFQCSTASTFMETFVFLHLLDPSIIQSCHRLTKTRIFFVRDTTERLGLECCSSILDSFSPNAAESARALLSAGTHYLAFTFFFDN